jgi:hypothetical protein
VRSEENLYPVATIAPEALLPIIFVALQPA